MPIVYRPVRADELQQAQELVVRSINDLTQRHGFGAMASVRPAAFQLFSLNDDPGGLWVADAGGEMLGCAFAWACGNLWFLAELFVAPGHQGKGIGNELLKRSLAHAEKSGATIRALITFTFNTVSQGLYIRRGLFPRLPVYLFGAAREAVAGKLQAARHREPPRITPIEASAAHLGELAKLDAGALGIAREKHHRFLLGDTAMRGFLFHDEDGCAGYAYVSALGHVGPVAAASREKMAAVFEAALGFAAAGDAPQVSALLPGTGEAALGIAGRCGMRIAFPMVLVSSHDFGDWTRYVPRNPGFM